MPDKGSLIPIEEGQLETYGEAAISVLESVTWLVSSEQQATAEGYDKDKFRMAPSASRTPQTVSLTDLARVISHNRAFPSENSAAVLNILNRSLRLAFHMAKTYESSSGLNELKEMNRRGQLPDDRKAEFTQKISAMAAVEVFVLSYYSSWQLKRYLSEHSYDGQISYPGFPEFTLFNSIDALKCLMYYLGIFVRDSGKVVTDLDFAAAAYVYFDAAAKQVKQLLPSLQFTEFYSDNGYKFKNSDFCLRGFEIDSNGHTVSVEFKRVEMGSMVGNRDAKHFIDRLAYRLLCYRPEEQRNVMFDLGGISTVTLGFGTPGTGKTMIIGALSTLLQDLCQWRKIPYKFLPHPSTIVSTFQGGSKERAEQWWHDVRDPSSVVFAPVDDAENSYEDRTRQGVSAGVREVISSALNNLEGASAIWKGGTAIMFLTNIPDQIDPAILSRIMARFPIDGFTTLEDALDQDHIWWNRIAQIDPAFIDMDDPDDYEYLKAQKLLGSMAEAYADYIEPKEATIREIFEQVSKRYEPRKQKYFGYLYKLVKERYPKFSSRDLRNIQKAIDERLMDFDFPADWLGNPEVFFQQEYDRQKEMLIDLMRQYMKGKSFAEIRRQEAMRYLDGMVTITETGHRREVERRAEMIRQEMEARELVARSS